MCVIVTDSTPPTSKCSSSDLLPHGDPDLIGGFRVACHCVAGIESRYGLVFTKNSLLPVTGSYSSEYVISDHDLLLCR